MIRLAAFSDEADALLDGQIKAMLDNDISLIEIRAAEGKGVAEFTVSEAKEYNKKLCDNGISVWSVGSPLGKVDINVGFDKYLDYVKHVCELACIFKTDKIRMFSFYNAYNERNKVLDYLNRITETGKEYGVFMCHENEKDIYGDVSERVEDILNNVKDIKCVYDPANFIQCDESADKTLEKIYRRADYFHIKDVIASTQEIVPAGYGDGKIDKMVAMVNEDKVFTLEPHLKAFIGYSDLDKTAMKNKLSFISGREAFDFAVKAFKKILMESGYKEVNGAFVK